MAVVVFLLFTKINSLNEENEKLKAEGQVVSVYTVSKDIEEGAVITVEDLESATMKLSATSESTLDVSNYIDPSIFYETDELTGEEKELTFSSRVKIPAGTVVTLSMLKQGGMANDERLMEYNMIVLPSQMKENDYVDIRFRLANGTETVVLAKKKIEKCTDSVIWMKMNEDEILTLNSAIVDAYVAKGSQLRATLYTTPVLQDAIEETYPVNDYVLSQITYNPNILEKAKQALIERWSKVSNSGSGASDLRNSRREIDSFITDDEETRAGNVESKYGEEASTIQSLRSEYISSLEGSGYTESPSTMELH